MKPENLAIAAQIISTVFETTLSDMKLSYDGNLCRNSIHSSLCALTSDQAHEFNICDIQTDLREILHNEKTTYKEFQAIQKLLDTLYDLPKE